MLDITLVENIYLFLQGLETDGFVILNFDLKVISKLRNRQYYKKYKSLEDFYNQHVDLIEDNSPSRYCKVGDLCFIENIKISNTVTNYLSEFSYYNLTSGEPIVRDKTNFNFKKNEFFQFDISKYIEYLKQSLLTNLNSNISLADARLNSYVDACYVDINYVDDNPTIKDSIQNNF